MKKIILILLVILNYNLFSQSVVQPEIVIFPTDPAGTAANMLMKDPLYIQGEQVISTRLLEKGFKLSPLKNLLATMEAKEAMGKSQGGNMIKKIAFPGDFKFEFNFSTVQEGRGKKVRIRFKLIENGTDDLVGSGEATSEAVVTEDVEGLIGMAVDNAMPNLVKLVGTKWEAMGTIGMALKIDVNLAESRDKGDEINGKIIDREFEDFLDAEKEKGNVVSWAEGGNTGGNLLSYIVYVDIKKVVPGKQSKWARNIEDFFKNTFAIKLKTEPVGKNITFEEKQ